MKYQRNWRLEQIVKRPMLQIAMVFACVAGAHAQAGKDAVTSNTTTVNIEAYGDSYSGTKPVNGQLSKAFFYRSASVLS